MTCAPLGFHALSFFDLEQPEVAGDSEAVELPMRTELAAASSSSVRRSRPHARSRNDQRIISWMRNRIVELEKKLKDSQRELDQLRARPAPSTEREQYLLSEMDLICRQLECQCFECRFRPRELFDIC